MWFAASARAASSSGPSYPGTTGTPLAVAN